MGRSPRNTGRSGGSKRRNSGQGNRSRPARSRPAHEGTRGLDAGRRPEHRSDKRDDCRSVVMPRSTRHNTAALLCIVAFLLIAFGAVAHYERKLTRQDAAVPPSHTEIVAPPLPAQAEPQVQVETQVLPAVILQPVAVKAKAKNHKHRTAKHKRRAPRRLSHRCHKPEISPLGAPPILICN